MVRWKVEVSSINGDGKRVAHKYELLPNVLYMEVNGESFENTEFVISF